jgi:hypothetical protein
MTVDRIASGVFTVTITSDGAIPFLTTSIIFGQPALPGVITVIKDAIEGVYNVTTVDLAGAPLDNALDKTLLSVSYNIDYENIEWR